MAAESYDFAIFGSSPLATLVAGLLASAHKRSVCLVREDPSEFRLPRGLDLSVGPITRPETWSLLSRTVPETVKLVTGFAGRGAAPRVDPLLIAESGDGADALSHMRHVAAGFGMAVERVADAGLVVNTRAVMRLRDARVIMRPQFERAAPGWLEANGVRLLSSRGTAITLKRDGSCRIEGAGVDSEAAQAVLADSTMIMALLDADERDRLLTIERQTTIVTEPTGPLAAPVMLFTDRGVSLHQRPNGGVSAIARGRADAAAARIGACLAGQTRLRRAGQTTQVVVGTADGAPLLGTARGLKTLVVAGLGLPGAFLAPALARHLADVTQDAEKAWFAARDSGRGRGAVAEYRQPAEAAA